MKNFDLKSYLESVIGDELLLAADPVGLSGKDVANHLARMLAWLDKKPFQQGEYCVFQDLRPLESLIFILACLCRGLVAVPLNPRFQGEHLEPYLSQIPAHHLVQIPELQSLSDQATCGFTIASERAALAIFTSGSSGLPKAVLHSWSSLENSALGTLSFYQLTDKWTWLLSLGLFHVGGLMIAIRAILGSGCLQVSSPEQSLADAILRWRPQWLSLVPTQLQDLIAEPEVLKVLKACDGIILGGSSASALLLQKAFDLGLPISMSYGSSETAAQMTATPVGFRPSNLALANAGLVLPGRELLIEEGSQRILCRGPSLFLGYLQKGSFHPHPKGKWYQTSDRGRWTPEGLQILGRLDDVFMCGGEGLSLSEIQSAVDHALAHPKTTVCRMADERLGEVPVLVIEAPKPPDLRTLLLQIDAKLPSLKRPRRIFWTSQPLHSAQQKRPIGMLELMLAKPLVDSALVQLWEKGK